MKLSNTGRLIADVLPDTVASQWSCTEPSQDLLELTQNPDYQPMVIFPASHADKQREVTFTPLTGRPSLFIMPDGTWPEARKMFRESPYLDGLPVISVDLPRPSTYHLCGVQAEGQYCTAEIAVVLLNMTGGTGAAARLGEYSTRFETRYLAGKTQHLSGATTKQLESVQSHPITSMGDRYESAKTGGVTATKVSSGSWHIGKTQLRRLPDDM